MAAILHILKRDIRASWILLCAASAFLVFQVVRLWQALSPENLEELYFPFSFHFSPLGVLVMYLIFVAIIVRLIHEDPLVGTSAFWLTRPISRKSLLLAKGLFVFLFLVIVPVAMNLILLFHFGMKSSQVLPFLFTMLAIHLAIICALASLAVVTPNWPSFIVAAIGGLACQFVANNWLEIRSRQNEWISSLMLFGLLLLCLTFSVVVHQYLTRKTLRSVVLLISGFVFVWLSCHFYIWDAFAPVPFRSHNSDSIASSIELVPTTKANEVRIIGSVQTYALSRPILGTLDLRNIPVPDQVVLARLSGRLNYPNGEKLLYAQEDRVNYGIPKALQSLLPGFEWINLGILNPQVTFLSVSKYAYKKLATLAGTYTGEAQLDVYRSAIVSEIPLISGGQINIDRNPITIRDVEYNREIGNIAVNMESQGLTTNTDDDEYTFCVLNRARRQAFRTTIGRFVLDENLILFGVDLAHKRWSLNFTQPRINGTPTSVLDEAWLAGASLVIIKRDFVGSLSRKFEIKNFRMADYSPDRMQNALLRANRDE
jgi:hypothetical protein